MILKKIARFILFTCLAILIIVNVLILLSGRFYLYKGIGNTYLKGQTGPSIYELDLFHNKKIDVAERSSSWFHAKKYNTYQLSNTENKLFNKYQTRAFLVFKGDSLLYENYFDEHHKNTVSNSFSAAKTVVALLIGIAIEEGKIKSLDDKVGRYLPEFNNKGKEKITIRHLLMMASGLDWEESSSNPLSENAESYYGTDLYHLATRQKAIAQPGKTFIYQSGNSQLLGLIIKKATGKSVATYTEEKLWKPIGAENQAFWNMDKENGDEKSFCCLYASARDFGRLGKLILNEGLFSGKQLVPRWYMKEMFKLPKMNTEENIPNQRYGLHIWSYQGEKNPIYYCRGIKGQYIISIPKENLVIVRLGLKRADDFNVSRVERLNKKYWLENQAKVGHPTDFFEYLQLGRVIAAQN